MSAATVDDVNVARSVSEEVGRRIAEGLDESTYASIFSPEGLARQTIWDCEDGWLVGYTTARIRHGRNDGKFAVITYKPTGKGARSGDPESWERNYFRTFATRKAARNRAESLYYRHSPKAARRHGVVA